LKLPLMQVLTRVPLLTPYVHAPVQVEPWFVVVEAQLDVPSVGLEIAEQVAGDGHDHAEPDQTPLLQFLVAVEPVPHRQEPAHEPP